MSERSEIMPSGYFYITWEVLKQELNLPDETEIFFVESRIGNQSLKIFVKHPDLSINEPKLCIPTFERKDGKTKFLNWNMTED